MPDFEQTKQALLSLLDSADLQIQEWRQEGKGVEFLEAAEKALAKMRAHVDDIAHLGLGAWNGVLSIYGAQGMPQASALMSRMNAEQIISDMVAGAQSLHEDTFRRQQVRRNLLDLLAELGVIGARLLLSILAGR